MAWSRSRPRDTCRATPAPAETLLPDAALVAAAQHDPRAFTPLYRRYVEPIHRYCYARLGSRALAEDATSEVFVKALAALGDYRDGAFSAWLFRIAHNVVIDLQRRQRRTAPFEAVEQQPDPDPTPDESALARAADDELRAALGAVR